MRGISSNWKRKITFQNELYQMEAKTFNIFSLFLFNHLRRKTQVKLFSFHWWAFSILTLTEKYSWQTFEEKKLLCLTKQQTYNSYYSISFQQIRTLIKAQNSKLRQCCFQNFFYTPVLWFASLNPFLLRWPCEGHSASQNLWSRRREWR